eukprot:GHUV01005998.1.p1 GENE.GHUV01005998.1~~GHUV01005998.1.p1  ORF type:complete len:266 (+),score=88.74 GHUV01005998.1:873-1670(+)
MPSQAHDTGYGGAGSGGRGRSQNSTLRAVTIRQLCKGAANTDDDMVKVDGVDLNTVTVIGRIVNVMENNLNLDITVHDGTGQLRMTHYITDDSEQAVANKKAEWQPGVYVRAFGHVTRGPNGPNMNAYSVRMIQNFNEVTYHYLRCIFEHLHLTKGAAGAGAQGMGGAGMGTIAPAAGGWNAAPPQRQMGGATAYAGAAGGGSDCQIAVQEYIQGINDMNGVHISQVYTVFNGRYTKQQIDATMKALVDEAHVYTTVDDDHYRAA